MESSRKSDPAQRRVQKKQLRKLEAEIEKIEAEKAKIDVERTELQRQFDRPWFRKRYFYQAVVAGIVSIPLIWFFITEIAIPMQEIENIRLSRNNELVRDSLEVVKDSLVLVEMRLNREIQTLLLESEVQAANARRIDSLYEELATDYRRLSQQYTLAESERVEFAHKADVLDRVLKSRDQELEELRTTLASRQDSLKVPNPRTGYVSTFGDFNGDDIIDTAYINNNKLIINLAGTNRLPISTVRVALPDTAESVDWIIQKDINRDGYSDILVSYGKWGSVIYGNVDLGGSATAIWDSIVQEDVFHRWDPLERMRF